MTKKTLKVGDRGRRQLEHVMQSRVMKWTLTVRDIWPELNLLYAIPNGEFRDWNTAKKLKAEGQKKGLPDTHFPVARGGYLSLYMELKTPTGRLSDNQKKWIKALTNQGHLVLVPKTLEEAKQVLVDYCNLEPTVYYGVDKHDPFQQTI